MRRREFIAALGGAVAWPVTAGAQQTKTWRVGYLSPVFPPDKSPGDGIVFEAFRRQMNDLGYVEGKMSTSKCGTRRDKPTGYPVLPTNCVSLPCDVIVAVATPAIAAAQRATSTIPIVMSSHSPIRLAPGSSKALPAQGETLPE